MTKTTILCFGHLHYIYGMSVLQVLWISYMLSETNERIAKLQLTLCVQDCPAVALMSLTHGSVQL